MRPSWCLLTVFFSVLSLETSEAEQPSWIIAVPASSSFGGGGWSPWSHPSYSTVDGSSGANKYARLEASDSGESSRQGGSYDSSRRSEKQGGSDDSSRRTDKQGGYYGSSRRSEKQRGDDDDDDSGESYRRKDESQASGSRRRGKGSSSSDRYEGSEDSDGEAKPRRPPPGPRGRPPPPPGPRFGPPGPRHGPPGPRHGPPPPPPHLRRHGRDD